MKILKVLLINSYFLFLNFSNPTFTQPESVGTIQVEIQNIQTAEGSIRIAIYRGEENFLEDGKAVVTKAALVEKAGTLTVSFPNLPYGEYSVAIYHDLNNNNKLNTNLVGIPSEPYGFSNDARSKWGPPKYKDARFSLNQSQQSLVIQLKKWIKQ